jgi:hypothetical protein
MAETYSIKDHCNGLLLVSVDVVNPAVISYYYVVNPATQCWDILPSLPSSHTNHTTGVVYRHYLAFDPTASSHYLVFRIPYLFPLWRKHDEFDPLEEDSEWPPSLYKLAVFSSRTRCWEERSFVREGDAVATVAKMRGYLSDSRLSSVYWRGSLYVHCQTNFVMRYILFSIILIFFLVHVYPNKS